jgi:peptidyl-prolyl cis-trans isomerase SurA
MTSVLQAQTIFTYGDNPISKPDFIRVYQKNNFNKTPDYSDPGVRAYLDLYSLFLMKVKEADEQHIDTVANIQRELDNYRKQLVKNSLTDEIATNKLMQEAYERMKEEIHVAHILIMAPPTMIAADTLVAFQKIDSMYKALSQPKSKADFTSLAKRFSEDKGSKDNGGDIGFVTALQTVYPFENAMYSTPVGKVCAPFRSQFGYHLIKVIEKRPARGEVKVAQIMASTPKSKGDTGIAAARKRMEMVEAALKHGEPFDSLVKKYSDDKYTVNDRGVMKPFGCGRMVPVFENAAFALQKSGDISPIIQTEYGFHIIKMIERYPLKPYDTLKEQLKHKVENDSRAQYAHESFVEKVKEKNGFKEIKVNMDALMTKVNALPDTGKNGNTFKASDFQNMMEPLFALGGKNYSQADFMTYAEKITHGRLTGAKGTAIHDLYKMYVDGVVTDFEEHRLIETNEDFRSLMNEYKSGIMLFELMDRNVWGRASKDSAGLRVYHTEHKDKWKWDNGFVGSVFHFKDEDAMKAGVKMLSAKKRPADSVIVKELNTATNPTAVTVQHGHYEFKSFKEAAQADIIKGKVTKATKNADGSYTVVKVEEVYNEPTPKTLDECRGYVIAEYQDYLEKQWNKSLHDKYPIKINEEVFKTIGK